MEREAFLARTRELLAGVTGPRLPGTLPRTFASGDQGRYERFAEQLTAVGGEPRRIHTYEIADAIAELSDGTSTAVVGADLATLLVRVEDGLRRSGCRTVEPNRDAAVSAALGITGADLGVASTGSILIRTGPDVARAASLLPPTHICLLPEERIVAGFEELAAELPRHVAAASQVVLITGPSRTSDIERTLVWGAHGPIRLVVLVVVP